jgi:1,4-alpha-glucan branching enzyme
MSRFHARTSFPNPGLHVWREGTDTELNLLPITPREDSGAVAFEYEFEPGGKEVRFMLFNYKDNRPDQYEDPAHQRMLPRQADGSFAEAVWFAEGAGRVLDRAPDSAASPTLRVHLISKSRYRPSELYLWDPATGNGRRVDAVLDDQLGPVFEIELRDTEQSLFCFKFIRRNEANGAFELFEPDFANRLWSAHDGGEIWVHSETAEFTTVEPEKKKLRLHYRQEFESPAKMHFWQQNSDFEQSVDGVPEPHGWSVFEAEMYTHLGYGFQFWNPDLPDNQRWEHAEAKRGIRITGDEEFWTLEGDRTLFRTRPEQDKRIKLQVAIRPPFSALDGELFAHVWVNRSRGALHKMVPVSQKGEAIFATYADVVNSVKFHDGQGTWERLERHTLQVPENAGEVERFVVLERPPLLAQAPLADLFTDPPFLIRRPGAYEENGDMHFILHAPEAAQVDVIGEWTDWTLRPVPMRSTRDGSYWWARVSQTQLGNDYHGMHYQLRFNGERTLQDPAAGWVDSTWNGGKSRLVQSERFIWHDQQWQRPGWEYLTVYQLHAARFTGRFQEEPALLKRVAREIDNQAGYLRGLGITAILLLPLNEVGTTNSWGYDPAFFYAIESGFGGPDALKELVDTCHRHGLAVLIDVVFNHGGTVDNILWDVARESFFDGDTAWGAMINFDHPQCQHFFAQNLVYLAQEYHIDGFRLDHTGTIVHSNVWDGWSGFVRKQGTGGGWDFLHGLRYALHTQVDPKCLLMAEHLPNEWSLTNYGGPMDTQWGDNFHDRMVDACRGQYVMSPLAEAFKLSHTDCDNWYKVTNYSESHDEVGNVPDRIAHIAGWRRGWRMNKVAAAATLLSRGIPMFFMGEEAGEHQQFSFGGNSSLDLDNYLRNEDRSRIRNWWCELLLLRRNPSLQGPAPLDVCFAEGQLLAFTRGQRGDFFIMLNFGGWAGHHNLGYLNLPEGDYRELWNSTWPVFAVRGEDEDEHTNGGRNARLNRSHGLHIPDYGVVVLERID